MKPFKVYGFLKFLNHESGGFIVQHKNCVRLMISACLLSRYALNVLWLLVCHSQQDILWTFVVILRVRRINGFPQD